MTDRVLQEWRNRVAAEYRSAALAAAVLHAGIAVGFPPELLRTALRVVGDELDHADLSHACLEALRIDALRCAGTLDGADEPVPLRVTDLWTPSGPEVLADLVDRVVRDFCLGETLAVPLFDAMRRHATHPAVRPVITRVLQDEAIHRQFGWDALDALLAVDPDGVRARVRAILPALLDDFGRAYAPEGSAEPLADEERSAGLLDLGEYRELFHRTVREDIGPRLQRRGIDG